MEFVFVGTIGSDRTSLRNEGMHTEYADKQLKIVRAHLSGYNAIAL
jgi:hypothetical protein